MNKVKEEDSAKIAEDDFEEVAATNNPIMNQKYIRRDDVELWLFSMPKSFSSKFISGSEMVLGGVYEHEESGNSYELSESNLDTNITNIFPNGKNWLLGKPFTRKFEFTKDFPRIKSANVLKAVRQKGELEKMITEDDTLHVRNYPIGSSQYSMSDFPTEKKKKNKTSLPSLLKRDAPLQEWLASREIDLEQRPVIPGFKTIYKPPVRVIGELKVKKSATAPNTPVNDAKALNNKKNIAESEPNSPASKRKISELNTPTSKRKISELINTPTSKRKISEPTEEANGAQKTKRRKTLSG